MITPHVIAALIQMVTQRSFDITPLLPEIQAPTLLLTPGASPHTPIAAQNMMRERFGPEVEWSDDMLQPVSNLHWLTRMLQNLLHVFGAQRHYADLAAMLELEMLLWPNQTHLQRDLALVLARIGLSQPASAWLDHYLRGNPDDPQKTDLEQLLEVLSA
jgi:regulator of sirC expression with transglutaminase-like and TPR domain